MRLPICLNRLNQSLNVLRMRGVLGDAPLLERQATRANLPIDFVKHRFGGGHRVLRIQRQDDDVL